MSKHKGSDMKMCTCLQCRYRLHTPAGSKSAWLCRKAYRHKVKTLLKLGLFDSLPSKFGLPYTS